VIQLVEKIEASPSESGKKPNAMESEQAITTHRAVAAPNNNGASQAAPLRGVQLHHPAYLNIWLTIRRSLVPICSLISGALVCASFGYLLGNRFAGAEPALTPLPVALTTHGGFAKEAVGEGKAIQAAESAIEKEDASDTGRSIPLPPAIPSSPVTSPVLATTLTNRVPVLEEEKTAPSQISLEVDARAAYLRGDYSLSKVLYSRSLERESDNAAALTALGTIALRENRTQEALQYFQLASLSQPGNIEVLAQLEFLRADINPVSAESHLRALIEEHPSAEIAIFNLGSLLARQSRWREAQEMFFRSTVLKEGNVDALYNLGVALDHLGKTQMALQYYKQAIEKSETVAPGFNLEAVRRRLQELGTQVEAP
jgi:tetratricopeptide (TPR) repeat protein